MAHLLHVFTPETWVAFRDAGAKVTGFTARYRRSSEKVKQGDVLLCYMTDLSRWCGLLCVESPMYEDDSPIYGDPDPYSLRFRVEPIVVLDPEFAIPIRHEKVWSSLSFTRDHEKTGSRWTGFLRTSLNRFNTPDAKFLDELLRDQSERMVHYPLSDGEKRRIDSIPKGSTSDGLSDLAGENLHIDDPPKSSTREESLTVQANVALVGAKMGCSIWVPPNDRQGVEGKLPNDFLAASKDSLPIHYGDQPKKTIEQIDVLWFKGTAIVRAFEIEHTTAIYSGLLRMADLLALLPGIKIPLHIVAPLARRKQVLREINRPAFSPSGGTPLRDLCTYLSYDSINELMEIPHLSYTSDQIVDRFAERAIPA